jgi:hypothetical protein
MTSGGEALTWSRTFPNRWAVKSNSREAKLHVGG